MQKGVCVVRAELRSAPRAVSTLTSVSSRGENLFSTVMFVFALHAQNMYKTTESKQKQSYEQSINPYLYLLIIIKI